MNDNKKKLLKIGITIVIVIIVCIILLMSILNFRETRYEQDGIPADNNAILEEEKVQKLDGISDYFNLKTCIENYYSAITNLRTELTEEELWYAQLAEMDTSELERSR